MNTFNCISNGCARVVWQPYKKSSGIRYRYSGEDWINIDGDDWSIKEDLPQDYAFKRFSFDFTSMIGNGYSRSGYTCGTQGVLKSSFFESRVLSYDYGMVQGVVGFA